ncbi:MAG: GntR family transcriptional regulator [Azospirillaceae bacterium]|nr:GntR family transcriptional regulator [Azospirillaceae bacterium]
MRERSGLDNPATNTVAPTGSTRQPARRALSRSGQQGGTVAASIYRQLRSEIVSMRRRPGAPVVEKQITETFGVSRTPVREALLRLADEGLVEIFPQSGTFIAPIPLAALPEASVIRMALEEATVRYAAQRALPGDISSLRANIDYQHRQELAADQDGFHEADETFHALIASVAGYPGFWPVIQQVKVQIDRFRRLTLPVPGRMGAVVAEHAVIVDAIAAHDENRAIDAMQVHLDALRLTIDSIRTAHPDDFSGSLEGETVGRW